MKQVGPEGDCVMPFSKEEQDALWTVLKSAEEDLVNWKPQGLDEEASHYHQTLAAETARAAMQREFPQ